MADTTCSLQVVGKGLQDPHAKVREQAAFALGQLAEHCQPEINDHAREALPLIFGVLQDQDEDVQEQAFYALVTFCDTLGEPGGGWTCLQQQSVWLV